MGPGPARCVAHRWKAVGGSGSRRLTGKCNASPSRAARWHDGAKLSDARDPQQRVHYLFFLPLGPSRTRQRNREPAPNGSGHGKHAEGVPLALDAPERH